MDMRTYRTRRLMLTSASFVIFCIGGVSTLSVILPEFADMHGWEQTHLMWVYPTLQIFLMLGGVVSGKLIEKYAISRVMVASGIIFATAWIIAPFLTSLPLFYVVFCTLAGLGAGLAYSPCLANAQKWYPDKGGIVNGILATINNLSIAAISMGLASVLIPFFGSSTASIVTGVTYLLLMGGVGGFLRTPPDSWRPAGYMNPSDANSSASRGIYGDLTSREMLRTRRFYLMFAIMAFACVSGATLLGASASIARTQLFTNPDSELAQSFGGFAVATTTIGAAVGSFIIGIFYDRYGGHRSLLLILCTTLVALLVMSQSFTPLPFFTATAFLGLCFGGIFTIYPPFLGHLYGRTHLGSNWAIMYLAYTISTWLTAPLLSILRRDEEGQETYTLTFYGAAIITTAGLLLTVVLMLAVRIRHALRTLRRLLRLENLAQNLALRSIATQAKDNDTSTGPKKRLRSYLHALHTKKLTPRKKNREP